MVMYGRPRDVSIHSHCVIAVVCGDICNTIEKLVRIVKVLV